MHLLGLSWNRNLLKDWFFNDSILAEALAIKSDLIVKQTYIRTLEIVSNCLLIHAIISACASFYLDSDFLAFRCPPAALDFGITVLDAIIVFMIFTPSLRIIIHWHHFGACMVDRSELRLCAFITFNLRVHITIIWFCIPSPAFKYDFSISRINQTGIIIKPWKANSELKAIFRRKHAITIKVFLNSVRHNLWTAHFQKNVDLVGRVKCSNQ